MITRIELRHVLPYQNAVAQFQSVNTPVRLNNAAVSVKYAADLVQVPSAAVQIIGSTDWSQAP